MSLAWFIFASLSVVGSVAYNLSMKLAGDHVNPFVFTVGITLVALVGHLICLGFYKLYMGEAITLQTDKTGLLLALAAGIGIVIIDLGFFFAVRSGGLTSSMGFWVIGSLTVTTLIGYFVFHETFSITKLAGIVLGAVSLFLLTRP